MGSSSQSTESYSDFGGSSNGCGGSSNGFRGSSNSFGGSAAPVLNMASYAAECYIKNEIDGSWQKFSSKSKHLPKYSKQTIDHYKQKT